MPNRPQQKRADKSQYTGKAFLDYAQACGYLGIKLVTLHKYMRTLNITSEKFELERKHFLAIEDVQIMERVIEEPWRINELKKPKKEKEQTHETNQSTK